MILNDVTYLVAWGVILWIVFTGLIILAILKIHQKRYRKYLINNSKALRTLNEINDSYDFLLVKSFDMEHSYDNENFYENISPQDYLIYQLVYIHKDVLKAINYAHHNNTLYTKYKAEIDSRCHFGQYDDLTKKPKSDKYLLKIEERLFHSEMIKPETVFDIEVILVLRTIQGAYRRRKTRLFFENDIVRLINKVQQRRGSYYLDKDVWDSICRVERGKVSNKMRFAIMSRDGNRCVLCGSRYNLEIDHIIPIAKGGKSTYSNLQTLCHRCNVKKGATIE